MFKPCSVVHTLKIPILQCLPTVWFVGILPLACFPKLDDKTFGEGLEEEEEEDMFLPMEIDSLHSSAASEAIKWCRRFPRESTAEVAILNSGIL